MHTPSGGDYRHAATGAMVRSRAQASAWRPAGVGSLPVNRTRALRRFSVAHIVESARMWSCGGARGGRIRQRAGGSAVSYSSAASNRVGGDTNGVRDVFEWTRASGDVQRVSVAGDGSQSVAGNSDASAISADGRYVAFASTAPNLIPGDTNLAADV